MRPSRLLVTAAAVLLATVGLAACGDDDDGDTDTATATEAPSTTTTAARPVDVELATTDLGEIVVDAEGWVLYLFTRDSEGTSACEGQCAQLWPPAVVDGDPTAGEGIDAELTTITRSDGSRQLALDGHPLYRYAPDGGPGKTTGQGVGGVWWVVRGDGSAIQPAGATSTTGGSSAY